MSEIYIIAKQDRRRAGIRFNKGKNGPFKSDDLTKDQVKAIVMDPYLEPAEAVEKPGKSPEGRKKSAAQIKAEKKSAADQENTDREIAAVAKAIQTLPEGTLPTVENVSEAMKATVTEAQLKAALEADKQT